ncbi:MAG: FISUMP domain-containing protein [Bacteroidales bacterium]|nr:FISUMP domain-containing protein [Bacteroidales bacterium]
MRFLYISPVGNSVFIKGTDCKLMWWSTGPLKVNIDLYKGPDTVYSVATAVDNTGSFVWRVSNNVPEARNYYFLVSDSEYPDLVYDSSRSFAIIPQSEYSSLTDPRDGQNYKTVKIGNQWWMAENFRFVARDGSYSYADVVLNSDVYGRLYTLQAAIDNALRGVAPSQ